MANDSHTAGFDWTGWGVDVAGSLHEVRAELERLDVSDDCQRGVVTTQQVRDDCEQIKQCILGVWFTARGLTVNNFGDISTRK